jgi:hypothetical protein
MLILQNLVAESIDRFLVSKGVSLVQSLLRDLMVTKPDPAYSGPVFDLLIAFAMRNAALKGLVPSFLQHISWASGFEWTGYKRISMLEPHQPALVPRCPVCCRNSKFLGAFD